MNDLTTLVFAVVWLSTFGYSLGKLKTEIPQHDSSLEFMIRFVEALQPGLNNIAVNPLNFAKSNPDDFTKFTKNLNDEMSKALVLSGKEEALLLQEDVYICFLNINESQDLNKFLETIYISHLQTVTLLIWTGKSVSGKEKDIVSKKAAERNITEVVFFFLADRQLVGNTFSQFYLRSKVDEVIIILENLSLSKVKIVPAKVKFVTNQFRFFNSLQQLQKQMNDFRMQYKRLPVKVLVFLQPGSVEQNNLSNKENNFIGVNINLIKLLSQNLNISYVFELGNPDQFGIISKNGTFLKAWQDLIDGVSDININHYPLNDLPVNQDVEMFAVDQEQFCFMMEMPQNIVRRWDVFHVFQIAVWICILFCNVFAFVVFFVLKDKNWKNIWFFQSILSAVHIQVTLEKRRILWVFWLFYVFLINNCFTCVFVTQLMPQSRQRQHKTMSDLREGNITLLSGVGRFNKMFARNNIEHIEPFYGSFEEINETSALLTTFLTRRKMYKMFGSRFYSLNECLQDVVGPMMLSSHRNSEEIKDMIRKITQTGILQYWSNDFLNRHVFHEKNVSFMIEDRTQYSSINVQELEYIFAYFSVGLTLAIIVFVCELVWNSFKPPKKEKVKKLKVYPFVR